MKYFISESVFVNTDANEECDIYKDVVVVKMRSGNYWKYIFLNIHSDIKIESNVTLKKNSFPSNPLFIKNKSNICQPIVHEYNSLEEPKFFLNGREMQLSYNYEKYAMLECLINEPICYVDDTEIKQEYLFSKECAVEVYSNESSYKVSYQKRRIKSKSFYLVDQNFVYARFIEYKYSQTIRKIVYRLYLSLKLYTVITKLSSTRIYDVLYDRIVDVDGVDVYSVEKLDYYMERIYGK